MVRIIYWRPAKNHANTGTREESDGAILVSLMKFKILTTPSKSLAVHRKGEMVDRGRWGTQRVILYGWEPILCADQVEPLERKR